MEMVMELGNVSDKQHYRGKSEHLAAKKMLELACLAPACCRQVRQVN